MSDDSNHSTAGNSAGPSEDEAPMLGSRWPELGLGVLLMVAAVVLLVESQRLGSGWDEFDGPRAGYFPFYVGLLLLASSGWIVLRQLLGWRSRNPNFADRTQLGSVWAIVWPMTLYVALVQPLGIYVASALLIGFFMRRHGGYKLPALTAVSLGVPLFFFVVFERYFLVALPKGPIETWLGF